jgi:hypothetical protein
MNWPLELGIQSNPKESADDRREKWANGPSRQSGGVFAEIRNEKAPPFQPTLPAKTVPYISS